MILRKPYAFFIKHFRTIHVILSLLMLYSLFYTKRLLDFFNEYINLNLNLRGQELASIYTPFLFQIVPFLIIITLIVVLCVLVIKKKPKTSYIINTLIAVFNIVIIQVSRSTLLSMQLNIIDSRTSRLVRDFIMLSLFAQILSTVLITIRAIGFDIKKFDFKQDLKEFEVSDADREEFELEINFDKNKTERNIRRKIRYLKYAYKENKLFTNILIISLLAVIFIIFTAVYIKKEKPVKQNVFIQNNGITLKITNSYMTDKDYKGNVIDEDSMFVILKVDIKNNTSSKRKLDIATTILSVGDYSYAPTYEYKDSFFDFGEVYKEENLKNEFEKKTLIYRIPKQLVDKKISFKFINKNTLDKKRVKLDLIDLSKEEIVSLNLGDEIDFKNSILESYKLKINGFDLSQKYKLNYNFCIQNVCKTSTEYLTPSISGNKDKILLKLNMDLSKEQTIPLLYDAYDLISSFATIYYTIDDEKVNDVPLKEVVSTRAKENNIYYIEVSSELLYASSIKIEFNVRNKIYKYIIK